MTRPAHAFAPPPIKRKPAQKRDTSAEFREKEHVRQRDKQCVYPLMMRWMHLPDTGCQGPVEVDHVRASGGLGIKSPTHRSNMVCLCRHHHRLKTEYGRVWRPLLLSYLERVES